MTAHGYRQVAANRQDTANRQDSANNRVLEILQHVTSSQFDQDTPALQLAENREVDSSSLVAPEELIEVSATVSED